MDSPSLLFTLFTDNYIASAKKDEKVDCFTLIVLWLFVFYVSPSQCHGLVCMQSVIVAITGHTHF